MTIDQTLDSTDKVAVITGGSGVLCSAIAHALGQCGASVILVARTQESLDKVAADIRGKGGHAIGISADVLDKQSLESLAERVMEEFGQVDILINGAGGAKKEATTSESLSFFDLPEDAVRWVFDLNFMGTFLPCQVFSQLMVQQQSGSILNIASMGAYRPLTKSVAYSAAKAAIVNFTQWLAVHISQEYSSHIRVNAIAPGFFLTEQNRFLLTDEQTGELNERGKRIIAHTPMGRFGRPEDLVGAALMLLSDVCSFIHGTVIIVDGGFDAYGGV